MKQKQAIVIGSGFAGMSAASFLARSGWKVMVLEQHEMPGGRARKFEADGFTFDMAPAGIGCPMYLNVFLMTLIKNRVIIIHC